MVVVRSRWVPTAQVAAATRASSTLSGRPDNCVSSCHSKKDTPSAAAATPSQLRARSCWPKNQAPNKAEKTGMV